MTSEDWQADRQSVFERDAFTCQHCESTSVAAGSEGLRIHSVGPVPMVEDAVPPSVLVTVCDSCYEDLHDHQGAGQMTNETLFEFVRKLTRTQGEAIAIAASFASLATSLPEAIAANEDTAYSASRREFLLVLDLVDAHLERLAIADRDELSDEVASSLEAFTEIADCSQAELREVIDLVQAVVAGLGRCHVCFEPVGAAYRCPTCGTAALDISEWQQADGKTDFSGLYSAINDLLGGTSETTEQLTTRTTALAELLVE
ncbi:MAG: HNH endonuclease [Natrialbaceae archaeon]|nr:HNH endonuclease [Natrialbaceae archaeon]